MRTLPHTKYLLLDVKIIQVVFDLDAGRTEVITERYVSAPPMRRSSPPYSLSTSAVCPHTAT